MQKTKEEFKGGSKVIEKCKLTCSESQNLNLDPIFLYPSAIPCSLLKRSVPPRCLSVLVPETPHCCGWKPRHSPCPTSLLLLPEFPYSPCTRLCCAFLSLLRGAFCVFSFLMLGATWTSRPITILFGFPFYLVDNSFRLLTFQNSTERKRAATVVAALAWI